MEKRKIEKREEVIKRYFEKKQGYKIRNNLKTDQNAKFHKIKNPVKRIKPDANYEKRIKQLEMEVELLRDFLYAAGSELIGK